MFFHGDHLGKSVFGCAGGGEGFGEQLNAVELAEGGAGDQLLIDDQHMAVAHGGKGHVAGAGIDVFQSDGFIHAAQLGHIDLDAVGLLDELFDGVFDHGGAGIFGRVVSDQHAAGEGDRGCGQRLRGEGAQRVGGGFEEDLNGGKVFILLRDGGDAGMAVADEGFGGFLRAGDEGEGSDIGVKFLGGIGIERGDGEAGALKGFD